jgi:hypothetical protein
MSANKSWHMNLGYIVVPRETYAAQLDAFKRHKDTLLDILRKVHADGPKSERFDEDDAWRYLVRAAVTYLKRPIIQQKTVRPARRSERLHDLAKSLGEARDMACKALRDEVGIDLFRGWCAEANIPEGSPRRIDDDGNSLVADEIMSAVAGLATLEAAAKRAARDVPTRAGAPKGTGILSFDDAFSLREAYRRSTRLEPGRAAGPIVELVGEFLTAVGRGKDTSQDYVVETLDYLYDEASKRRAK